MNAEGALEGAVKGAVVGGVEVAVAVAGWLALSAWLGSSGQDLLENILLTVMIVAPVLLALTVGAGFLVGWALGLPRWWLVVPAANVTCYLVALQPSEAVLRASVAVVVFALAGAWPAFGTPSGDHPSFLGVETDPGGGFRRRGAVSS